MINRIYIRGLYYTVGIIILTLGIALTIHSQLGTSPFDALLVGLYRTYGLTIGSWEIVVGFSMIVFNSIAERRTPELIALFTSLLTGLGIDFWYFTLDIWILPFDIITMYLFLFAGIIISGLGIAINLQADFAPNPFDRMMLVTKKLTGMSIFVSRGILSILLVIIAFLFNGAIGVGTLIIAVFSGFVIQFFMNQVMQFDKKITS